MTQLRSPKSKRMQHCRSARNFIFMRIVVHENCCRRMDGDGDTTRTKRHALDNWHLSSHRPRHVRRNDPSAHVLIEEEMQWHRRGSPRADANRIALASQAARTTRSVTKRARPEFARGGEESHEEGRQQPEKGRKALGPLIA